MTGITERLQKYYTEYKYSIVRITVKNESGDLCSGTGFHIGEGYIVTAKHIIENKLIEIIGHFESRSYECSDVFLPKDHKIDLAILKTDFTLADYMSRDYKLPPMTPGNIKKQDSIPLDWYLSSMVGRDIELMKVLVFGYPAVPCSLKSHLLATTGEINAFIERYGNSYPHFIISVPPRGGYSGGPVIGESGHVMGVVTESLFKDSESYADGFFAVISVDVLLNFMKENEINPEGYDGEDWYDHGPGKIKT